MKTRDSGPSAREACKQLVEQRDVQGLLEHVQALHLPLPFDFAIAQIGKCIRAKAKEDLSGLSEDAFGVILGLGVTMLTRCKLHIETRLAEADRYATGTDPSLPSDLIDERWLERAERISRFCAEMAALRARMRQLNRLDDDRRQ